MLVVFLIAFVKPNKFKFAYNVFQVAKLKQLSTKCVDIFNTLPQ